MCPEKRVELDQAKVKEWNKIINSGAMLIHCGSEAERVVSEVGTDRVLASRFVYTSDDGIPNGVLKARWCTKGYLDPDVLDVQTASPTLSNEGLATALQLVSSFSWKMTIADIEGAFLRGDEIQRDPGQTSVWLGRRSEVVVEFTH